MTETTNDQRRKSRAGWVIAAVLLAASALLVFWPSDKGSDLDKALCNDLDAGLTVVQIRPADMTPERFAQAVYTATDNTCPEHRDDPGVAALLEAWNLD